MADTDVAGYLCAILSSRTALDRVTPLQTLGLFGPRDSDKKLFAVPVPAYDRKNPNHQAPVALAGEAEGLWLPPTPSLPGERKCEGLCSSTDDYGRTRKRQRWGHERSGRYRVDRRGQGPAGEVEGVPQKAPLAGYWAILLAAVRPAAWLPR